MATLRANGIELAFEELGDPQGTPLVLVMGLGAQLIHWPDGFCERLAACGYRVIRYDNRDAGLSERLSHLGTPNVGSYVRRALVFGPRAVDPPYLVSDMARDLVGLLDGLGIERAHVVGMSMGGMIAQAAALQAPSRLLSLSSLSSTAGGRGHLPRPRALRALIAKPADGEPAAIERGMKLFDALRGPRFEHDVEGCRELARRAYRRSHFPEGFARQLAAVCGSPNRLPALRRLRLPTLVLHGTADPLIPVGAGKLVAAAVPGARLHLIEGWGHHLPAGVWSELVEVIDEHARAAEAHQGVLARAS